MLEQMGIDKTFDVAIAKLLTVVDDNTNNPTRVKSAIVSEINAIRRFVERLCSGTGKKEKASGYRRNGGGKRGG